MEWIETTGKSVEEAIDLALDRLGIHKDELEYETMEAGKKGVFGIGGSEARIKSRVKPKSREKPKDRKSRNDSKRSSTKKVSKTNVAKKDATKTKTSEIEKDKVKTTTKVATRTRTKVGRAHV